MGPIQRYLGPLVPAETLIWQDPVPAVDHELVGAEDIDAPQEPRSWPPGCRSPSSSSTAWASASTFRGSDKRGGANGARIRLEPQRGWAVNEPERLAAVLAHAGGIQESFNAPAGRKKVSLADLIVLGGCAAVERAAADAGHDVDVPFTPGRTDATQEQTDVEWFAALEPAADGFRNYREQPAPAAVGAPAGRPREPADAERAGDDRPRGRPAGAGRELPAAPPGRAHRDGRAR